MRQDEKDYLDPPLKWHRGRRSMPGLPKRLDYLTDREYLDALCRDLKRQLEVECARTDYWRAKSKLYMAKLLRYAALLDQQGGQVDSDSGVLSKLEDWLQEREDLVKSTRGSRKG